ncbi:sulfite exporter TauE/SafE family protein 2-like [Andrographis paniculata]|uniref:sulfite exporter TauE/SafE family protein 2-like n=1 Tax=Andrographis paniculata TaxID=175694 RepID=UPI0021E896B1|nr:sulfite exporter TauE/SafE family protein 2-like [Andrographis paniculata]
MGNKSLGQLFMIIFCYVAVIDFNYAQGSSPPVADSGFLHIGVRFLVAGCLSFIAAAISSAGGIGGGGLFVPILTIVAGLDVKTASSFSAFMVTGGAVANVASHIIVRGCGSKIDYDIALLSEPSMLLGVSCGVILNLVLPEWLITGLFVVFIAFCTFKTFKSGILYWQLESQVMQEDSQIENEKPLLEEDPEVENHPWMMKLGMLVVIWVSFFLLYLLRGDRHGRGIIQIEVCGKAYWMISMMQIPLAVIFTTWILFHVATPKDHTSAEQDNGGLPGIRRSGKLTFPVMALLAGGLGGVFGIGGGMLISPLLLQIGIEPEVTAATCSFMVLFSSSMSAIQYLLLGMQHIRGALVLSAVCFVASLVGLTLVQRAILKYRRASLIVFSVGTVMALSTILMTTFGAIETWRDYTSGQSMGFNKPC